MIKKKKKQSKYIFRTKEFTTFKNMKAYAYFNMGVGTEEEALEINEDQIMKAYKLIKQERRLLCIKTYDVIEKYKNGLKNNNLNYLKMDKKKIIYEIIKIVCTAIISIAAVITAQSCTMSLSVSKNNSNSTQKTEQTTTSSVDSTKININQKK